VHANMRQQARHPLGTPAKPTFCCGYCTSGCCIRWLQTKGTQHKVQVMHCCLHMTVHRLQAPDSAIQQQLGGCRQLTSRCWWLHTLGSPVQRSLGSGIGRALEAATGSQETRSWSVYWLPVPPAAVSGLPPCTSRPTAAHSQAHQLVGLLQALKAGACPQSRRILLCLLPLLRCLCLQHFQRG
jgi:hypothetical protein